MKNPFYKSPLNEAFQTAAVEIVAEMQVNQNKETYTKAELSALPGVIALAVLVDITTEGAQQELYQRIEKLVA